MKKEIYILCLVLLVFLYCKKKESHPIATNLYAENEDSLKVNETRKSIFEIDSTLKPQKVDLLLAYSDSQIDTLIGFCNCEKNVKDNSLKIQIRTEFPSLSELEKGNRNSTEFQMGVPRQYRFLTFYLRDSIVLRTKIFKASTEPQFENEKIDSTSFIKYEIRINKMDYEIAQNVWGNYVVQLVSPFGYTSHDDKIKGTFHCNNWKIVEYEELPEWTVKGGTHIE